MSIMAERLASRGLAVTILVGLLGLVFLLAVTPLLNLHRGYDESIADLRYQLNKLTGVEDRLRLLKEQRDALQARTGNDGQLLAGDNEAAAGANLHARVKSIVVGHGGTFESVKVLPAKREAHLQQIPLKVRASGTINALQKVFYDLEMTQPYQFINSLSIRADDRTAWRNSVAQDPNLVLDVSFEVHGFRRAGAE